MLSRDCSGGFSSFKNLISSSVIKKGAENLAVDHFSRLENPHQSVLDKKEINEMFPLETLSMVSFRADSSTPWFADFANYHAGNFSSGGVFTAKKPLILLRLATMDPPGDIMAGTTPLKRCLTPVSIGPQFIVMPMTWSTLVTLVNVTGKSRKKMKCHKMQSKFVRSLTFEVSILWDHSRLHEGTSIYLWPLIVCRNGSKQKRSPPTTPELIAPDFEASRARGFVLRSLELHILSFILGIQYPNLID
ncbi:hypothetical protein Tco_1068403 [Tanacetum coccineum]|uniref:Reverse transcriptase domain-containing protein n=1 Tax=Tanacetum coccineum TaxID=301880 RepID=A0ABQ5HFM0_9ASTR